ncbi:transcriptional regulator CecR [Intestinirhabdus alba]|jgi:AcrR family transcriptional regulator|uniref:Transcriptional regulator n=1 Tax=Intestinirhabdus alba TaxID=2899544 RepID=A0A6L6IPR0_9ENTR|nr:transcriptional regulator CecR [Intestinirhabdus alba]MTH47688.1 transcriptional regulator [Intestinirhabdus alba]
MSAPGTTTRGEQAKQQLIASALAQFGEYGLHATTRDIAARAGQNIAAITYYFGSKEALYLACARWIADFISERFRPYAEEAERLLAGPVADRAAIRALIVRACRHIITLLTQDDTVNLSKFISREQLSPTAAYRLVHDQVIDPLHRHLTRLIAACTGGDPDDTRTILHTHALLGEVLAFRLCKETILLRTGWPRFDEEKRDLIAQIVTEHIDFILQGLSQRSPEK